MQFVNLAGLYVSPTGVLHVPQDVVESEEDLVAKHGPEKFRLIHTSPQLPNKDGDEKDEELIEGSELGSLKVVDLRKMANDLGIDIRSANNKSELIALIEAATKKAE